QSQISTMETIPTLPHEVITDGFICHVGETSTEALKVDQNCFSAYLDGTEKKGFVDALVNLTYISESNPIILKSGLAARFVIYYPYPETVKIQTSDTKLDLINQTGCSGSNLYQSTPLFVSAVFSPLVNSTQSFSADVTARATVIPNDTLAVFVNNL
ncbi:hypothetical protein, partial [Salmonella sp. s51228]|uniref:hypothetical protein n=1 Tax=Salmonella sp. s51228 TaxID=3159652 RepID=UPI00397FFA3E